MQQDLYKMAAKAKDVAKKEIQIMELERRVQLLVEENGRRTVGERMGCKIIFRDVESRIIYLEGV